MQCMTLSDYFTEFARLEREQRQAQRQAEVDELSLYYQRLAQLYPQSTQSPQVNDARWKAQYQGYTDALSHLYRHEFTLGCEINVWEVSGLKRDEVRNTAVLSWWLDANASHALGYALLKQVIEDHLPGVDVLHLERGPYSVCSESLPLAEIQDRIDIEIFSNSLLMFWEVKIDAPEGAKQLARYHQLLQTKRRHLAVDSSQALVYLTTDKQIKCHTTPFTYGVTWKGLRKSFLTVLEHLPSNLQSRQLLGQYCQFIRNF
ncbi:PD-(D/E)XK nuclease family protein [Photobacterium sanguinicancri]|uniref:PD-(D/E)XK nuclease family protein n=1 Tax=Photobacterium sanguinicancri TaxID=875932 RepID=A0AAW7Y5C1_9GAMM|nr:PD-(D/E)XK nuclease family protein [Photobacterium sanguinicancri]MDO6542192.1 PD-(D/E)XK nuclease family protein [Photobacterium sanguinicancri]